MSSLVAHAICRFCHDPALNTVDYCIEKLTGLYQSVNKTRYACAFNTRVIMLENQSTPLQNSIY